LTQLNYQTPSILTLDDIENLIQEDLEQSKRKIQSNFGTQLPFIKNILPFILNDQRKLFRPMVLILSTRLFTDSRDKIFHTASVLEYLNTAAIMHQKIIITEEFRRKQKDLTELWGNEASVLLGDYLLSISFQIMTSLENLDLIEIIAETTKSIAEGQVLSISEYSWSDAEEHYFQTIENQKVSLYTAAAKCGGILGNASSAEIDALSKYGFHLGMVIQLSKDLKHLSNSKILKARLIKNHTFFPLRHLMQKLEEKGLQKNLKEILSFEEISIQHAKEIFSYFEKFHVEEYTKSHLDYHLQQTEKSLSPLSHLNLNFLISLAHSVY